MKTAVPFLAIIFLGTLLSGCGDGGGEIEAPVVEAPVAKKGTPVGRVVNAFRNGSLIGQPLPDDDRQMITPEEQANLTKGVSHTLRLLPGCEDPDAARDQIANLIGAKVEEAAGKRMWSHVAAFIAAYKRFRPQDQVYDTFEREAKLQMNRPRFALRGFYYDYNSDTTTGIFKILDPVTGEKYEEKIRMGEAVRGIRFVRVIGKDEGAEIEFEGTGQTFSLTKGDDYR